MVDGKGGGSSRARLDDEGLGCRWAHESRCFLMCSIVPCSISMQLAKPVAQIPHIMYDG